ncbi:MAG: GNAT family N-acetyltransferase [Salinibacterium sp.]|nr:GNAT family N-acetyltransferase [Salinibacterium sp.]
MIPVTLTTPRLVLDQPTSADSTVIAEYCTDPVFEINMTTPWPYELKHATHFVSDYVPMGWRTGEEYTWAIRSDGVFLGMVGYRVPSGMIGYWLGAPHRGQGIMTEAATAVVDWLFSVGIPSLGWECIPGNTASVSVARKLGFTFLGLRDALVPDRDGSTPPVWQAALASNDDRSEKPGWP